MDRLTPELFLHSAFDGDTVEDETRELDFNLARRSAVVINRIVSQVFMSPDVTSGFEIGATLLQEVDLDPDNLITEFVGALEPDAVVVDSSRVLRHVMHYAWDTAAGAVRNTHNLLIKDWHHVPWNERPVSMTNLRHHINTTGVVSNYYQCEVNIDYFIVELSILEIGILNSSRR